MGIWQEATQDAENHSESNEKDEVKNSLIGVSPFAQFVRPPTVYDPDYDTENDGYIEGFFYGWDLFSINPFDVNLSVRRMAKNIDLIARQARESFMYSNARQEQTQNQIVNLTEQIGDRALNSTVNNAFTRIAALENWKTTANDRITAVDNARISNYNTLSSRISDNYKTLWDRTVTLFENDKILENNIEAVDANRISNYQTLSTRISNNYATLWDRSVTLFANDQILQSNIDAVSAEVTSLTSPITVIKNLVTIIRDTILTMASDLTVLKNLVTVVRDKLISIDSATKQLTLTNADGKLLLWERMDKQFSELQNLSSLLSQTKNLVSIIRDKSIIFDTALKNVNSNLVGIQDGITLQTASNVADTLLVTTGLGEMKTVLEISNTKLVEMAGQIGTIKSDTSIIKNLVTIIRDKTILFETAFKDVNKNLSDIKTAISLLMASNVADTLVISNSLGDMKAVNEVTNAKLDTLISGISAIKSETVVIKNLVTIIRDKTILFDTAFKDMNKNLADLKTAISLLMTSNVADTLLVTSGLDLIKAGLESGFETLSLLLEELIEELKTASALNNATSIANTLLTTQALGEIKDVITTCLASLTSIASNLAGLKTDVGVMKNLVTIIRDKTILFDSYLKASNKHLETIISVLGSILAKPFDFEKLKEILDNLNFGNIVNEAGTNIWDFLTEALKTLGDVLTESIGALGDILESILDFLDSLLDKLISLIVPENMDFLEDKADGISEKFKMKFGFAFNWVDSFKGLFGSQTVFQDFRLNLGGMFSGDVNIPLSLLNDVAAIVKPILTGFVLLEFLIDMYKWFHTRGELIE